MDREWEFVILVIGGMVAAVVVLPRLLPDLVARVIVKLLSWNVVVPAAEALVQIPATDVGLDLGRLLVGAGVLVLATCVGLVVSTRRAQA